MVRGYDVVPCVAQIEANYTREKGMRNPLGTSVWLVRHADVPEEEVDPHSFMTISSFGVVDPPIEDPDMVLEVINHQSKPKGM